MAIDPVRLKQLFQGAVAISDQEQRAAWLVQECGADADLLAKLKALLIARDDPASFLDRLAPPASSHTEETGAFTPNQEAANSIPLPTTQEKPGHVVGRYKLLECIGEGGMGSVWMAEQREPVKRLVALKLIKAGMDTQAVLTRFEAERQALALMDHPNIAKVLDGGTTESGRPFFVMELVKGLPLTEYCDNRRLSVDARLQLFIQICSAVQHAHQKGIIHRDLKPSNVLVTEHDGRPVPKVIDFGLAKALNATNMLTDRTLHTAYGTVVGTPLYMAPEQVGINALDTDTRSDVYALGVMLYELLTGTTPLEKKRFKEAAWEEVKRIIQEEEPPRPSLRLSTSNALPNLAANRHTEPAKLTGIVRGELDWIVMKALEKDRNRRYETANGFAMDLQRYLANEAVTACPPSAGYRIRKFVSRNKGKVLAASLVLAALLFGILGTTWGMMQARAERDEKELARQAAEESFQRTRQVVDDFFTLVSQNTIFNVPGLQPIRKDLLEKARVYYQETLQKRPDDPDILAGYAAAYFRLTMVYYELDRMSDLVPVITKGVEHANQLYDRFPLAKEAHVKLAGIWHGERRMQNSSLLPKDYDVLSRNLQDFIVVWRKFLSAQPDQLLFERDIAIAQMYLGQIYLTQSEIANRVQEASRAKAWLDPCISTLEKLVAINPKDRTSREFLKSALFLNAVSHNILGKHEEAIRYRETSDRLEARLAADFPDTPFYREFTINAKVMQINQLMKAEKYAEAEKVCLEAMQLLDDLHHDQPGTTQYGLKKLGLVTSLSQIQKRMRKPVSIDVPLQQLLETCRQRLKTWPNQPTMLTELISVLNYSAEVARERGRLDEAEVYMLEARTQLQTKKPEWMSDAEHQEKLGTFLIWQLRPFYELTGRQKDRDEACRQAHTIFMKLSQINDSQSWLYWFRLGEVQFFLGLLEQSIVSLDVSIKLNPRNQFSWNLRGEAYRNLNQYEKAIQDYSKAIEVDPTFAWAWHHRAWNRAQLGQFDQAILDHRKATELSPEIVVFHTELGNTLLKHGKTDEAIKSYRKASELDSKNEGIKKKLAELETTWKLESELIGIRQAVEKEPANPVHYRKLGITLLNQSKLDEAVAAFRKAIELEPNNSNNHNNLGVALARQKKNTQAITVFRKAIELDPKYTRAHHALAETLMSTKDQPGAIAAFRKVLELDPNNAGAMNNLAWMLLTADDVKLRNPQEALTLSRKAVELTKDNWAHLDTFSVAAFRNQQWQESLESREKMIKLRKPRTEDKFFLAMSLWKLDRQDEARKYFTEARAEFAKLQKPDNWLTEIKQEAEALLGVTTPTSSVK